MNIKLLSVTKPIDNSVSAEDFVAFVARIGKIKDDPVKLVKYLLKHKHFSPLEHVYVSMEIKTRRSVGRDILRHRSFTFQELSQRYEKVNDFEDIELRKQDKNNRQSSTEVFDPMISTENGLPILASEAIYDLIDKISDLYQELLNAGVARECARDILPGCTKTTIIMTGNLRSWIHFLEVRDHKDAQKEAQLIAIEIKNELIKIFPNIFKALEKDE